MSEKYGFVYIWYNNRRNMFYIGCHWGHENDGYICSSNWMRHDYKRHKENFKRRVVARTKTKEELYTEEFRWLSMIKDRELKIRYYNLQKWHYNHWTLNEDHRTTRQKISDAGKGRIASEETRQKKSDAAKQVNTAKSILEWNSKPENIEIRRQWRLGKPRFGDPEKFKHSEETKQKISKANSGPNPNKGHKWSEETRIKFHNSRTGIKRGPHSEETKRKIRESRKLLESRIKKYWYNNGIEQKQLEFCPDGWHRGRLPMSWINRDKRTGRLVGK